MKWTFNECNEVIFGNLYLGSKFLVLGEYQCILLLPTSFDVRIFFTFNFDIIMSYFYPRVTFICGTKTMLLFQKFIMNPFLS